MTITDEQKQKIRANISRLDYLEGTGVISTNRKHLANEFFVFISAGGVGHKALAKLKKTMRNQVDNLDVDRQTMFLAIDTAHTEMDESVRRGEFEKYEVLKVPYEGAHDSINPEKILPQLKSWVHESLWKKTGGTNEVSQEFNGTGAGAIRQCGRVLFSQSAVQDELYAKLSRIPKLLANMGSAPAIKVFFLCGIAGGTGSGVILDLAFLTRHFLKQILLSAYDRTTFSAYLFLPSACEDASSLKPDDVAKGNRNAYAALKEIDYYMTMTKRSERFVMDYGTVAAGNIDIGDDIFNFCTLVEGVGAGGSFFEDNAETSRQIVADSILNIICADNQKVVSGQSLFLVDSFLSNETAEIEQRIEARSDKVWPRDANYIYSVIGYSSCVVPVDLLTVYVVKKIFDEAYKRFLNAGQVDEESAVSFLEACGLDLKRLAGNWETITKKRLISDIQAQADAEFKNYGPFYMANLTSEAKQLIETAPNDYLHKAYSKKGGIMANQEKWQRVIQCYTGAADYLGEINHELYEVYSYALNVLRDLIEKNAKLLTDTHEYKNQFGKSFCWSPVDLTPGEHATKAVITYLDEMFDIKEIRNIARKFIDDLCEKKDEWTGLKPVEGQGLPKLDVAKAVRDFITENLQKCINTTLEQFVVKAYSGKQDAPVYVIDDMGKEICSEETKRAAQSVFDRLDHQANGLASTRGFDLRDCYSNIYLTVPDNCKWFYEAISNVAKGSNSSGKISVYKSSAKDRVVLCRLYAGVPAWSLFWTPGAEESYEGVNGDGVRTIGLHMDQGSPETDWAELPNLYPENLWSNAQRKKRKREEDISKKIRNSMQRAKELGMLRENEKDEKYYDIILLTKDRTAKELFESAQLDVKKKYDFEDVLDILVSKGELSRNKIEFINQVMTTIDDLTKEELEEFRFGLSGRTIRRFVGRDKLLDKSITVIEELKKLNDERMFVRFDTLSLFIDSLRWKLLIFDDRRNIWKLVIEDEELIGRYLTDKIDLLCAHYYGFLAFSKLEEDRQQDIGNRIKRMREEASNEQFDESNQAAAELKQSLVKLRGAREKTVSPWGYDSPFKGANESAWPMATQDFVERIGNEETAKAIREFYTMLIDNIL